MDEYTIKNLPDLLSAHLGSNKEIVDVIIKKLPQKGYGSIMLKVDLKIKTKNGTEETEHLVAKILHDSELVRTLFRIQESCKVENAFYNTILPTLRKFQKENGVDDGLKMFAKFYGARINLDGSDVVNDDAVLVLENLVEAGYENDNRKVGFDLATSKLILADLAEFQGTAIALNLKQPNEFTDKIRATCKPFHFQKGKMNSLFGPLQLILLENPETAPLAKLATSFFEKKMPEPRKPYASIVHNDLWVNNTMQKVENGTVVKNILLDFQGYDYRSSAADVFFFLWTSVQKSVLDTKIDELIEHYHNNLVGTIARLKCDTTLFSLEKFYSDIKIEAEYEFGHALMFAYGVKNPPPDFGELEKRGPPPPAEVIVKQVPVFVKEFLCFMTVECNKRGWLY